MSGYRFLIIEDEIVQAAHLQDMLTEMGGTVSNIAYGFDQGRTAVRDAAFDCVLLDVNLGGTLSFSIADSLRERGIPLVICTAYADAVDVYPGVRGVPRLNKPVSQQELEATIMSVLKA